jgi:O-acetyl-ADP-ribose deacetylase (regulator of RNase III)
MIEYVRGNLLEAPVEALVNTVNTVGVMGKGIALQFKRAFPNNFKAYARACKDGEVQIGKVFAYPTGMIHPKWILNVPTKQHWRQPSRLDAVRRGVEALAATIEREGIKSVAVPPLGCGAGGLSWDVVRPLLEEALGSLTGVTVMVYPPGETPAPSKMPNRTSTPNMTPGRAAMLALTGAYLQSGLDDEITTLELQKLAYFMQLSGERLNLRFVAHHYGPYADALRKVLEVMEGHYISGLGDDATRPDVTFELLPGALDRAQEALADRPSTRRAIDNVLAIIEGFEDPYGLELLATTHWVMKHDQGAAADLDRVVEGVHAWSPRKAQMKAAHIGAAWSRVRERLA